MSNDEKSTPNSSQTSLRQQAYQEEPQALRADLAQYVLESSAFTELIRQTLSDGAFLTNFNTDLKTIKTSVDELRDELSALRENIFEKLGEAHNRQIPLEHGSAKVFEPLLDNSSADREALHEKPQPNPLPPVVHADSFPESPAQTGGKPADSNEAVTPATPGHPRQSEIKRLWKWWKASAANLNLFPKILFHFLLAALVVVITLGALILAGLVWIF